MDQRLEILTCINEKKGGFMSLNNLHGHLLPEIRVVLNFSGGRGRDEDEWSSKTLGRGQDEDELF